MNSLGKIISIVLFLGGISTFVAWRMGAFESVEPPTDSKEKESIVTNDRAEETSEVDTVILPEQMTPVTVVPETDSEREFRIMSSSKSLQIAEPFPRKKSTYSDEITSEFLKKRTPKITTMPGSKSGPVFDIKDFTEEKKSLHPYLDSVTKADSLKTTPMMGSSKSLILSYPLEIKHEKKK